MEKTKLNAKVFLGGTGRYLVVQHNARGVLRWEILHGFSRDHLEELGRFEFVCQLLQTLEQDA